VNLQVTFLLKLTVKLLYKIGAQNASLRLFYWLCGHHHMGNLTHQDPDTWSTGFHVRSVG